MPTYEYACRKCGHEFERFQSMRDEPLRQCPSCGRPGLRRLVGGGAGLIFKGSGFYITDYKNNRGKGSAKQDGGGESKSTEAKPAAPATTSESKPAAATAAAPKK